MVLSLLWPKSPHSPPRKFETSVVVNHVRAVELDEGDDCKCLLVDVKWKGPRGVLGNHRFRKSCKRGRTSAQPLVGNESSWDESFANECILLPTAKNAAKLFQPWDVYFVVSKVNVGEMNKECIIGYASIDVSTIIAPKEGIREFNEVVELNCSNVSGCKSPILTITLSISEVECDLDSLTGKSFSKLRSISSDSLTELELSDIELSSENSLSDSLISDDKVVLDPEVPEKSGMEKSDRSRISSDSPIDPNSKEIPADKFGLSRLSFRSLSWGRQSKPQKPISPGLVASELGLAKPLDYETEDDDSSLDDFMKYKSILTVNLSANGDLPPDTDSNPTCQLPNGRLPETSEPVPRLASLSSLSTSSSSTSLISPSPSRASSPRPRVNGNPLLSLCPGSSSSFEASWQTDEDNPSTDNSVQSLVALPGRDSSDFPSIEVPGTSSSSSNFLPWRKRKYGAKSPKPSCCLKEPLLKCCGENGGDEIDCDRRETMAAEDFLRPFSRSDSFSSDGSGFFVGRWEKQHVKCRDGTCILHSDVFFASFDQRHESVGGEGACAVLVTLIAEWIHIHNCIIPTKTEFDDIIRHGSAEWRKLCGLEHNKDKYADKHLPLEAVFQDSVRRINLDSEKSLIGFFKPDFKCLAEKSEAKLEVLSAKVEKMDQYLQGLLCFDSMWEEVEKMGEGIYIVSWNDHFFVLMVQRDACFLIDTVGERLMEGCSDAFILRFDSTSWFERTKAGSLPVVNGSLSSDAVHPPKAPSAESSSPCNSDSEQKLQDPVDGLPGDDSSCRESSVERIEGISPMKMCGYFVKEFLASIPLQDLDRFLHNDFNVESLFKKLQVELHATVLV